MTPRVSIPSGVAPLWALAGLAFAARVLYLSLVPAPPVSHDAAIYVELARSMASGHGYVARGTPVSHFMPGYPVFLLPFAAAGLTLWSVRVAQAGLVALAAALTGLTARRLWGGRAGMAACATVALLPALFVYPGVLVSESLIVCLCAVLVWTLLRVPRADSTNGWLRWALGPAATSALLVAVKPEFVLWLPLPAVVLGRRERSWKAFAVSSGMTLLITVAVLTPWTVRNWRTFGVLMPLSSGSGPPLWLSAHEPALTEYETPAFQEAIRRCGWPRTTTPAVDECLRTEALAMIANHPGYYARGTLVRATRLFVGSHTEYAGRFGAAFADAAGRRDIESLAVKGALLLANSGLMIVGLLGLLAFARQPAGWPLLYMVSSKVLVHAVIFSTPRYGLQLLPVLAMGVAYMAVGSERPDRSAATAPGEPTGRRVSATAETR